jgi:hypothetical protein
MPKARGAKTRKQKRQNGTEANLNRERVVRKSKRRGRKTLCTPALTQRVCKHISNACTVQSACECEGISTKSFFEWLNKGEAGQRPYSKFRDAVMRAKGWFKARVCKSVIEEKDWRARLELLSRIYPDEFARTVERTFLPVPQEAMQPTTVVVNVRRGAESDAAAELFGERPVERDGS